MTQMSWAPPRVAGFWESVLFPDPFAPSLGSIVQAQREYNRQMQRRLDILSSWQYRHAERLYWNWRAFW